MIFNLNEQKVLSDPSGSSVFKGEKDFNDIVVNLPDEIDGHTATELKYVMHFVDSDGGYSTKILTVDSSGEALKATATVSTSITSKAQAFYAYVLMTDDEETVIGKTNGVIVMIHPVPNEENEIIPPADADKIIKGLEEIVKEATETIETATEAISSKQDKLTAGENITIENNVISAEDGGVTSYNDLTDKPQINGITLSGNKSATDLELKEIFFDTSNPPQDSYTKYPSNALWVNLNENTQFVLTATDESSSLLWFTWERLNNRVIQSTEPAPEYSGINVKYQYDNGDLWLQVDSGKITKISVCTGKDRQSLNYKTWRYFYYWAEFTGGGSQIVSGVVNANGTITFTDSEGNTFTTTGSSVIGADGFSPVATVTQTASGATISITDSTGTTTANISNGQDGSDYVLTAQDKSDIADIVLSELPTTQGVLYGNQSN